MSTRAQAHVVSNVKAPMRDALAIHLDGELLAHVDGSTVMLDREFGKVYRYKASAIMMHISLSNGTHTEW